MNLSGIPTAPNQEGRLLGVGGRLAAAGGTATAEIAPVSLDHHRPTTVEEPGVDSVGPVSHRVGLAASRTLSPVSGSLLGDGLKRVDKSLGAVDNVHRTRGLLFVCNSEGTRVHP